MSNSTMIYELSRYIKFIPNSSWCPINKSPDLSTIYPLSNSTIHWSPFFTHWASKNGGSPFATGVRLLSNCSNLWGLAMCRSSLRKPWGAQNLRLGGQRWVEMGMLGMSAFVTGVLQVNIIYVIFGLSITNHIYIGAPSFMNTSINTYIDCIDYIYKYMEINDPNWGVKPY